MKTAKFVADVPTRVDEKNADQMIDISGPVAKRRRTATFDAAVEIHGDREGALVGLWATFSENATAAELSKCLKTSGRVKKAVPKLLTPYIRSAKKQYETSDSNYVRSLATLYEDGLMSRKKFNSLRVTNRASKGPNIVPYNKLQEYINKSIPKPDLIPIPTIRRYKCNLDQMLTFLAEMYIKSIPDKNNWFGNDGTFLLAFGGDGAPLGKFSDCSSFLISFINVEHFVLSCDHSFTILVGYCHEDSEEFLNELKDLSVTMKDIESNNYLIGNKNVNFKESVSVSINICP